MLRLISIFILVTFGFMLAAPAHAQNYTCTAAVAADSNAYVGTVAGNGTFNSGSILVRTSLSTCTATNGGANNASNDGLEWGSCDGNSATRPPVIDYCFVGDRGTSLIDFVINGPGLVNSSPANDAEVDLAAGTYSVVAQVSSTANGTADKTHSFSFTISDNAPNDQRFTESDVVVTVADIGTADSTPPTVAITGVPALTDGATAFTATFTFDEAVTGFADVGDVTATNATVGAISPTSATVYTALITPNGSGDVTVDVPADAAIDAASNGNTTAPDQTATLDNSAPTVAITGVPALTDGSTAFTATFTFSEAVTGFTDVGDVTATNATVGMISATSATVYTALITPNGSGDVTVDVPADAAIDAASNGNTTAPDQTATLDNSAPTVAITGVPALTDGSAFTATFTFSEAVTDFDDVGDVTATNATVGAINATSATVYTALITPNGSGDVTVDVPADAAIDAASNGNTTAPDQTATLDATAPTVAITGVPALTDGSAFTATFTFSEAVTDFDDVGDVTATNATVGAISATSTTVYTALITPNGSGDVTVDVPANAAIDAASNGNTTAPDQTATLDATGPTFTTVTIASNNATPRWAKVGDVITLTLTANEALAAAPTVTIAGQAASVMGSGTSFTATTTVTGSTPEGVAAINVSAYADALGNAGTAVTAKTSGSDVTVDRTDLEVTNIQRTTPSTEITDADTLTFTVVFPTGSTNATVADFAVSGTTTATVTSAVPEGGNIARYLVTVSGGDLADFNGTVGLTLVAGQTATDRAGNPLNTTPTNFVQSYNVVNDMVAPTVAITGVPAITNGSAFTATFTFSEAVTGFTDAGDVTATNATIGAISATSTTVYTALITPNGGGNVTVDVPANAAIDAASNGNTTAPDQTATLDATAPTVAITGVPAITNGSAFTATFTFSEAVTGFTDAGDITATNATIGAISATSTTVYTALITPNGGGNVTVDVPASAAIDAASNGNTTAPDQTATLDATAPSVLITSTSSDPVSGAFPVTVTFSKAVSGFTLGDIMVGNGAASNFAATSTSVYTATITPAADGAVTVDVAAAAAADSAGNDSTAATQFLITNDGSAPTLTSIVRKAPTNENTNADSLTWTVTFSEPIQNLDGTDFTLSGSTATLGVTGSGTTYDVTASGGDLSNLSAGFSGTTVSLALTAGQNIQDTAGNALTILTPTGASESFLVNNSVLKIGSITRVDSGTESPVDQQTNADSLAWNIQFSAITGAFALAPADFTLTGTSATIVSVDRYSIGFIVRASGGDLAALNGDVTLGFSGTSPTDEFGNPFTDKTPSGVSETTYTLDNTAPTVVITGVLAITDGSPFTATFTFSEAVTGFADVGDVTATNATVGAISATSSTVYTALITPDAGGDVTVDAPANAAIDGASNGNTTATAQTATLDDTAPSVTITGVPAITNGSPFTATFTFSEAVTGFADAGDVTATNATVSAINATSTTVYTALITPDAGGDVTVDVPANAATNAASNGNTTASDQTAVLDNAGPTVAITGVPAITNGSPFTATFTFSEAVTGFTDAGDITATNATVGAINATSTTVYTALITPDAGGDVTVDAPANAAIDAASNGNTTATAQTATLDDTAPTVTITGVPDVTDGATAFTATFTFSEAVTGFTDTGDITATNATIGAIAATSATVYTALITPDAGGDVTVDVPADSAIDAASNGNTIATAQTATLDNTAPTLTITGVPTATEGAFTATFTFSEDVIDFTETDIIVTNGTTSNFQAGQSSGAVKSNPNDTGQTSQAVSGGASVYTVLITPDGEGEITITVSEKTLTDLAGNENASEVVLTTVSDTTAPTTMIDALPTDVRGAFTVTVRFNEDVVGFELSDITLSNATGSEFSAVSGSVYTALVTPIQSGTVIVDVVAGVAQDVAGNSNTAAEAVSTEYIDENFVRERTKRIINNFVARRADQITLNDPNLAGRLLSDGTGGRLGGQADHKQTNLGFNGKASGEDARLDKIIGADAAEKVNFWTRASLVSVNAEDAKNDMFLVYAGVDYKLNDDTIVGVMAQYDFAEEKNDTEAYEVSGKGWMVGPYIVSRVTDKLIYDGRAAWGLSTNDISPFKTYTDEFKTNRWLLKSQFTGDFRVNDWNVNPNLAVIYFQEDVDGYRDSLGIDISDQKVSLGRVTFGPRVSKTFETNTKTTLTPTLSVRGIWDFEQADIVNLDTGLATATGAFRARTEAGLAIGLPGGASLTLDSFYDGIGQDDYEAYGGLFGISFPLK